jgi:hypothetical protein
MPVDPLGPLTELSDVTVSVQRSRSAVDALLGNRVLRRRSTEVSAESLLRGAWASAALSGATATLADVRSGQVEQPLVQAALKLSVELSVLSEIWGSTPRQALARMHALAAAELVPAELLGKPRADEEVMHRLATMIDVLLRTTAPALVVAAVVHAEILALDAFAPVSGLIARAAARLTLIDRGLDSKSLVMLEVGHLELGSEYASAIAQYTGGGEEGVAAWVRHCASAVELGARESLAVCEALQRG